MSSSVRLIAFYLPQFHPIPENDTWWGKGFTEWTNVSRAKPLFKGHLQPKLPSDLGFYDLRVPETRENQARLAKDAGIESFCYWHYWFGNGRTLLDRPFKEVVASGKPDFPFCLAWANQTWTGIWHGRGTEVLMEQTYGGEEDYTRHFYHNLDAFRDNRYTLVDGKPLFLIYNPWDLPDPVNFVTLWNRLAVKEGLPGIYFVAIDNRKEKLSGYGMDGNTRHEPLSHLKMPESRLKKAGRKLGFYENPKRFRYSELVDFLHNQPLSYSEFPVVLPNWDNTPRSGSRGLVYEGSSPELFEKSLRKAVRLVTDRPNSHQIVFIKSWNEWAEGNFLEPDQHAGHAYLDAIRNVTKDVKL